MHVAAHDRETAAGIVASARDRIEQRRAVGGRVARHAVVEDEGPPPSPSSRSWRRRGRLPCGSRSPPAVFWPTSPIQKSPVSRSKLARQGLRSPSAQTSSRPRAPDERIVVRDRVVPAFARRSRRRPRRSAGSCPEGSAGSARCSSDPRPCPRRRPRHAASRPARSRIEPPLSLPAPFSLSMRRIASPLPGATRSGSGNRAPVAATSMSPPPVRNRKNRGSPQSPDRTPARAALLVAGGQQPVVRSRNGGRRLARPRVEDHDPPGVLLDDGAAAGRPAPPPRRPAARSPRRQPHGDLVRPAPRSLPTKPDQVVAAPPDKRSRPRRLQSGPRPPLPKPGRHRNVRASRHSRASPSNRSARPLPTIAMSSRSGSAPAPASPREREIDRLARRSPAPRVRHEGQPRVVAPIGIRRGGCPEGPYPTECPLSNGSPAGYTRAAGKTPRPKKERTQ